MIFKYIITFCDRNIARDCWWLPFNNYNYYNNHKNYNNQELLFCFCTPVYKKVGAISTVELFCDWIENQFKVGISVATTFSLVRRVEILSYSGIPEYQFSVLNVSIKIGWHINVGIISWSLNPLWPETSSQYVKNFAHILEEFGNHIISDKKFQVTISNALYIRPRLDLL